MPTVEEYRGMMTRALDAGDQPAIQYFQRKITEATSQPLPEEEPVPQGGNLLDPISQGVTLGFADEGAGAASGLWNVMKGGDYGSAYRGTRDKLRERASQYAERNPMTSLGAELVSGAVLPLGAARTLARGIGLGAGAGAVTGAGKNEDPEDLAADMGVGGALGGAGGAAGQAASGLWRMVFPRRSPKASGRDYRGDVDRLRQAGIETTPGERLGNQAAVKAERQAQAYLGSGEELATRPNALRSQIMQRGGFDPTDAQAGELSDAALGRARDHFNREYTSTLANTHVDLGDMDPRLARIEQDFNRRLLDHEQKREVRQILDSFRDNISAHQNPTNLNVVISGPDYKRMRSNLGKRSRQLARQTGPNASLAPIYRDIQGALDDAFRANAPTDVARRLADVDSQYRHYAFLREVSQNPDNIDAIANRIMQSNADDDLKALARAYQNVIIRGGGNANVPDASGQIMPPLLSMIRAAGARGVDAAGESQMPQLPAGTKTSLWGQGSGLAAVELNENEKRRRAKRKRRYKHDNEGY